MVRTVRILLALCLLASSALADERGAAKRLEELRDSPLELRQFLEEMPKGGDLHNHLSGAVYAESYLRWAVEDGLCLDSVNLSIAPAPCDDANGFVPAKSGVLDPALYSKLIDAMSMRNYKPAIENGHDRFFATFGRYRVVSNTHFTDMVTDVIGREARDNVDYVELTANFDLGAARRLGAKFAEDTSEETMYEALKAKDSGVSEIVARSRKLIDDADAALRTKLQCGTPQRRAGCDATIRYIFEIHRGYPRTQVFTEMFVGLALASADSRVVAINPVMPEDGWTSMHDFEEQMEMLKFLRARFPNTHLTAHAGELAPGLVPPEELREHIWLSVMLAGAERIGHGVDIAREKNAMALMRITGIAVEICLTSNDLILGIRGRNHPLRLYLQNDVPVVLATDDPGVSRGDLTTEFQRAVEEHALTYAEIKRAARNSIQYSFLEGASLWKDAKYTSVVDACAKESKECTAFLDANPKAREQWRLEKRSANSKQVFRSAAAMPPLWVACLGCEVAGSRGEPGRRTYSPPILLSRKTGGL